MSRITDHIHVETIFDYKHGRRFQILITNPEPGSNFTIHKDVMTRDYVKLKLSDADIMKLIQELQRNLTVPVETRPALTLVQGSKEE